MGRKRKSAEFPEWALQITALREGLEINQAELARRMACSAMTISRWERGLLQPSAENYIQLGNLASKKHAWFFWERAGIQPAKMVGALRGTSGFRKSEPVLQTRDSRSLKSSRDSSRESSRNVTVPLLKAFVASFGLEGDRRSLRTIPASEMISVPARWCPNPDYTSLIPVKGHTMEPVIREGDMVVVDSYQVERESLCGSIVVASDQKQGLTLAYLRRIGTVEVLEANNRACEPVVLGKPGRWRIVGKVLWWISSAMAPAATRDRNL